MTQATLNGWEKKQLMAVLRELDPTGKLPEEMRQHKRRGIWQWLWIKTLTTQPDGKPHVFRILAKDVSGRGIGFFSRRQLPRGARFAVALRFAEGGGKLFLCRVTFCQETSQRHYAIGAQFVESINDDHADATIPADWM